MVLKCDNAEGVGAWKELWRFTKAGLGAASIERSALFRPAAGGWKIFTSFASEAEGTWRVIMTSCDSPNIQTLGERLPVGAHQQVVFDPDQLGLLGVKDPFIVKPTDFPGAPHALGSGTIYMFLSVAVSTASTTDQAHDTKDVYNTGQCLSATSVATSEDDGETWSYRGVIFKPDGIDTAWDGYCRRINSITFVDGLWYGFYDGIPNESFNYEEKTGLCVSPDLLSWTCLTPKEPLYTSPHGPPNASNALRYLSVHPDLDGAPGCLVFFEQAREDGAHELRLSRCTLDELVPPSLRPGTSTMPHVS